MRQRPRRNRKSAALRRLVRQNTLGPGDLIAPLFVLQGKDSRRPIPSMPGQFQLGIDALLEEARDLYQLGVPAVALFPVIPNHLKDPAASESGNPEGFYARAITRLKEELPELLVMTDVAMDPYSSDGHDGLVEQATGRVLNDPTLEILGKMALVQARAGSDLLGPSDMMDGRVGYLRDLLDREGLAETSIISYCAKYASAWYGPFRMALDSAPQAGDKKTYQMDPANAKEALREAKLDQEEGADILMVKPGLPYLDVLKTLREATHLPLAVYNTSGEYAMIKEAGKQGHLDAQAAMLECLIAFKRAGADIILTYFAKEAARLCN